MSESAPDNPEETMRITVVWQLTLWHHVVIGLYNHNHMRWQSILPFRSTKI
jgi:hypothetical protein